MEATPAPSFFLRHEFLIRRLHSLSGLLPVGAYMCVHLVTNASVLAGAETFQDNVDKIHSLGALLPFVEWAFIFLPLIFHAVVGVMIVRSGVPNTSSYPLAKNIRYTLQRATAWIALIYIFWHVFHMHGWIHFDSYIQTVAHPLNGANFDHERATSTVSLALAPPWAKMLYAIGTLSCVYHLANGLWTMGITWGVWVSPAAQRRANLCCAVFGVALGVVGLSALWGFGRADSTKSRAVESSRIEQREEQARRQEEIEQRLRDQATKSQAAKT